MSDRFSLPIEEVLMQAGHFLNSKLLKNILTDECT